LRSIHLPSLGFALVVQTRKATGLMKEVSNVKQWPRDVRTCVIHIFTLLVTVSGILLQCLSRRASPFATSCSHKMVFYVFFQRPETNERHRTLWDKKMDCYRAQDLKFFVLRECFWHGTRGASPSDFLSRFASSWLMDCLTRGLVGTDARMIKNGEK
jgi:hypothetical protein